MKIDLTPTEVAITTGCLMVRLQMAADGQLDNAADDSVKSVIYNVLDKLEAALTISMSAHEADTN